jgi:predicted lipid-binding transport protein (Tim44 family)
MPNGHETKNPPPPPPPPPPGSTGPGGITPKDGNQIPPQDAVRKAAGVGGAVGGAVGGVIGGLIGALIGCCFCLQHLH